MKKLKLLTIPLMAVPLLFIGCKGADPKINSQEEFNNALHFKNIKFAKAEWGITGGTIVNQCSPTVYHEYAIGEKIEDEKYVQKDGENYWEYTQTAGKWERKETTSSSFITAENGLSQILQVDGVLAQFEITYDKLTFKDGKYVGYWIDEDGEGEKYTLNFEFADKKWTSLKIENEKNREVYFATLTYDEVTPKLPEVDPTN